MNLPSTRQLRYFAALAEEARLPMIWGTEQNADLYTFYQGLIRLRAEHTCLRRGKRHNLIAMNHVLAYRRADEQGSLVTVLNLSEQEVDLELELAESAIVAATSPEVRAQSAGGKTRLSLPALSGVVLQ